MLRSWETARSGRQTLATLCCKCHWELLCWSTVRLCSLLWLLVNGQLCNFRSMVNQFCHLEFQLELRVQTIQIKGSWRNKRQRQNQNIIQWDSLRSALYKQKKCFFFSPAENVEVNGKSPDPHGHHASTSLGVKLLTEWTGTASPGWEYIIRF